MALEIAFCWTTGRGTREFIYSLMEWEGYIWELVFLVLWDGGMVGVAGMACTTNISRVALYFMGPESS